MGTYKSENQNYAVIYQITQECLFKCDICLRFYNHGEKTMSHQDRFKMVDVLKRGGIRSVSVTGGEPLILKEDLYVFLRYLHSQHIHIALNTTGYLLDQEILKEMNLYLDRLVISIRSLNPQDWDIDFGKTQYTSSLYQSVISLLSLVNTTDIILEVISVLHKENLEKIIKLGNQLAKINSNIVWRIDEYYPLGKGIQNRDRFELGIGQFDESSEIIKQEFSGRFRDIRFGSWASRQENPGLFITQSGEIMNSAGDSTGKHISGGELPIEFKRSRPWSEYKKGLRDWGWGDLD